MAAKPLVIHTPSIGWSDSGNVTLPNDLRIKGYEVAWTFLFMAHYGFLRDDVAPSGRINPYIGVGLPYCGPGMRPRGLGITSGAVP